VHGVCGATVICVGSPVTCRGGFRGGGDALGAEDPHPIKFYYKQGKKLLEVVLGAVVQFFTYVGKMKR